ncbi:MAG: glycosyltransferase family 2 protein [Burkholderiaceae bacterium]|nr:glycosyltransferase family 2 protein [Burkholderiaceae bacterium]
MRLSVAIIARNEAHNIAHCLRSVAWADEIVVVEHGSSDGTAQLARDGGARVIETPDWPGFGPQKNRALDACRGEWVLSLDADERVTDALRAEIEAVLAQPRFEVYAMPRRSTYCGRFIRHSGWWPDYVARLFRRGSARFSEARVHERLLTPHRIGRLRTPLLHYSFRSMEQVLEKVNRYSSDGAAMLVADGRTPGLGTAIAHGLAAFLRTYLLRLGFLDGRHGFMLAVSNAEGSYYRYVKAMLAAETRRDDRE